MTAETRVDIAGVLDDVVAASGFIGTGTGVAIALGAGFAAVLVAEEAGDEDLPSSAFFAGGSGAFGIGPVGFGSLAGVVIWHAEFAEKSDKTQTQPPRRNQRAESAITVDNTPVRLFSRSETI